MDAAARTYSRAEKKYEEQDLSACRMTGRLSWIWCVPFQKFCRPRIPCPPLVFSEAALKIMGWHRETRPRDRWKAWKRGFGMWSVHGRNGACKFG
eukprot:3208236-Rhodomonas_salina.3